MWMDFFVFILACVNLYFTIRMTKERQRYKDLAAEYRDKLDFLSSMVGDKT